MSCAQVHAYPNNDVDAGSTVGLLRVDIQGVCGGTLETLMEKQRLKAS